MAENPFFAAAKEAFARTKQDFLRDVFGKDARSGPSPDTVSIGKEGGTSLADLMYAFARGGKDKLIEKVTQKFRASSAGQQVEAEAKTQALQEIISSPTFIVTGLSIAVGIVLFAGLLIGRR